MKINFHNLQSQHSVYQNEINAAMQNVFSSAQFVMGEDVFIFERALSQFLQCKNIITCASGTDALLLALLAIDIQAGDEVITSPFSFISAAEAISLLGAHPIFVDIEADTYTIDAHKIEEKISAKTRAILPISLFGQPADMDMINTIACSYSKKFAKKIYVIEDAAQSFGATYKGNSCGNSSDIGCLSFFPTKPLGCYGDGGAVLTNDDLLAAKIKSLRVHGQSQRYHHKLIGINSRLDTIQAAILNVKLKYFPQELKQRKKIAAHYQKSLSAYDLVLPQVKPDRTSVYAQYSICTKQRKMIMEHLKNKNIPSAIHYPKPLHLQECFNYLGYKVGDYPVAEKTANEIMSLPMSAFITSDEQSYIINSLEEILNTNAFSYVS